MNDISFELAKLHILTGADFIRQLKLIVSSGEFHPVEGEKDIFSVGGEKGEDYENLMNAARKAVGHGYKVYVLPNPKGIRTADFILVQHGIFKLKVFRVKSTGYGSHVVQRNESDSRNKKNGHRQNVL